MSEEKCRAVLARYTALLERKNVRAVGVDPNHKPAGAEVLPHLANMIPQMKTFLQEGRIEKFMRWLGFMQGCLFTLHHFTLEELKAHNRPS